jgi:hypothetical protein
MSTSVYWTVRIELHYDVGVAAVAPADLQRPLAACEVDALAIE